ncbi:uncharacterized protein B0H64DRAFT_358911 [Chaetomium fimeti]|uniref:NACHT domain-containing protein n=1 Tax=Chaetomium fimeti TaxID=1854472 RepID=A0AAE0LRP7_9PEZI|nr:hypothetical protein B0H64DRAFT_358911 [Chaetomium fimeti]
MEALAAVGAASSILQLLDFTVKLIKTGKEVRESGSTLENEALESVYERMQAFLQPVEALAGTVPSPPLSTTFTHEIISSAKCAQKDCSEILGFLRELKVKNGGRKRWGSMVVAFKSIIKRRKIGDVEARLRMELNLISAEMSRITCDEIQKLRKEANTLAQTNAGRMATDRDLDNLSKRLEDFYIESRDAGRSVKVETLCQVTKQLKEQMEELNSIRINNSFLSSLYFPCLSHRHETIPENYANTFKWIYDIPRFRDWIECGSGIFWIHAKPGAGKSTLMKFLADNPQTRAYLDAWAAPCRVIIAAHYFWNLGSPMQKSMRGLLQTLVSEILHKAPHLVPLARSLQAPLTPSSNDTEPSKIGIKVSHGTSKAWTMDGLSRILQGLAQSDTGDVKLCLFVDGLDEFEGNHQEVCKVLGSLATSRHIKLCVRRLRMLPTDLGDLFKHILHRIDPVYMQKSAELLQLALHDDAIVKLPPEAYYYHERDFEQEDPAAMWPVVKLGAGELSSTRELAIRRITALTGGLLEASSQRWIDAPTVEFLHRTVADFLRTEDMNRDIRSRTRPCFDVHLALTKLNAILIISTSSPNYDDRLWSPTRMSFIMNDYIPKVFEGHNTRLTYQFLDRIEDHIASCPYPEFNLHHFRTTLLESRLFDYVSEKLSKNKRYFSEVDIDPEDTLLDADNSDAASVMLDIFRNRERHVKYSDLNCSSGSGHM